jgi:hypothetical protein
MGRAGNGHVRDLMRLADWVQPRHSGRQLHRVVAEDAVPAPDRGALASVGEAAAPAEVVIEVADPSFGSGAPLHMLRKAGRRSCCCRAALEASYRIRTDIEDRIRDAEPRGAGTRGDRGRMAMGQEQPLPA